jgi:transcriptional regulator with XRE-family HTH domain
MLTPFGIEIRKYRIEKALTLSDMAESIGVSPAYLSAIETGKRNISDDILYKILGVLQISDETKGHLIKLAGDSKKVVQISLANASSQSREMIAAFARKFSSLSSDDIEKIKNLLEKETDAK